jgi:ABC-type maltose transport system permease subunit
MGLKNWLLLAASIVVALFGLAYSAGGTNTPAYGIGLVVFLAAVGCAFYLIKQYFDRVDRSKS